MATISSINPDAAATLITLRDQMRAQRFARTALQATWQKHHAETAQARIAHRRRPLVKLV